MNTAPEAQAWGEHATGYRVGPLPACRKAAYQFRQPVQLGEDRQVKKPGKDFRREFLVPKGRVAKRDHGVIVRPNGAVVIRHRVITPLVGCQGSHSPSREKKRRQESFSYLPVPA